MKKAENVFFARAFLDDIIKKCEAKALEWVGNATPAQLVAFRAKAEGMMLAEMPEPKLLGMVTKAIALAPAQEVQPLPGSAVVHRKRRVERA